MANGAAPVRLRVIPLPPGGPPGYRVAGPDIDVVESSLGSALDRGRQLLAAQPAGGDILVLDEVGLVTARHEVVGGVSGDPAPTGAPVPHNSAAPSSPSPVSLRLPAMEKIDLSWYWHTQEQQPQPYTEIDSFRFRESRGWVEIEGPSDVGGWVRWWVGPDDSVPNVTLTIGDDMRAALLLGECAPGSPGAVLLEQRGSEAVALARYRAGYVNGVPLVATHFRVGDDLNTLLASPLERPPARPVAGSWAYETSHVVEAAHRVVQACGDVTVALGELSPAELRTISTGPRADWRSQLETAAAVSKQAKDVLSLLKVGLGLGRDIAELMA